jgi:hypothetical protein
MDAGATTIRDNRLGKFWIDVRDDAATLHPFIYVIEAARLLGHDVSGIELHGGCWNSLSTTLTRRCGQPQAEALDRLCGSAANLVASRHRLFPALQGNKVMAQDHLVLGLIGIWREMMATKRLTVAKSKHLPPPRPKATPEEVKASRRRALEWKSFRRDFLFSQASLADHLKCGIRTIAAIEHAETINPHPDLLRRFRILRVRQEREQGLQGKVA